MDEYLPRLEHEEFRRTMNAENKRMEDENNRQNERLDVLEKNVAQIAQIAASVERLATNMENMLKEQVSQGQRLEKLESQDGEKWRSLMKQVGSLIVGVIVGAIVVWLGLPG